MKKLLLIIAVCIWAAINAHAQCVIRTTTANNKVITETPEAYVYTRLLNQYHGLAIKTVKVRSDTTVKVLLHINETSTNIVTPKLFRVMFKDGTFIEHTLQYIKKLKVDNKAFNTCSFSLSLSTAAISKLSTLPISNFTLLSAAKTPLATIQVENNDMLVQQLLCITKQ